MNTLSGLAGIPGYGAYVQRRQMNEQAPLQEAQQATAALGLLSTIEKQQKEKAFKSEMDALGPNASPEALVALASKYGTTHDVLNYQSTALARKDAAEARRYAADTAAQARRDTVKATPLRSRIVGDETVQEELQPDGTYKEIGRGPRFAKSVVNVNAPSQEPLSPEAVRDLAVQSLYDSNVLAGYRRDTTAMSRIGNERVKLMKESGITSEDVVSGRAGFKADTASLNKITPQYDAITAFEQTAIRNGKILKDLAGKVDSTGVPAVERWIRAGRQATGDTDVAKFNAQLHLYRAEAARILTQPSLSGALTDTARKEMEDFLKGGASASQIVNVVDLLERDFGNRKATLEEQIGNIRSRMRARQGPGAGEAMPGSPKPAAAPASPTAAPSAFQEGQTATGPNGQKIVFKGGAWQPATSQ